MWYNLTSLCIDASFHPKALEKPKPRPSKSQRRSQSPSFHPSRFPPLSRAVCWCQFSPRRGEPGQRGNEERDLGCGPAAFWQAQSSS